MANPKTKLQLLAEKAMQGDEQALKYLQLEEMNVISDKASSISWQSLCANDNYFAHLLVVSTKLGLECLKTASRLGLKEAIHIARHHYQKEFPPVATTVTVENLAELLSEVLKDVPPHYLDRSEDEESSSASEVEPEPEKTKKNEQKNSKNQKKPKKIAKAKKARRKRWTQSPRRS